MNQKEKFWNIPNALSLYRLLVFPLLIFLLITEREKTFVILFAINLATDILDGFIARRFNMQTEIGARLDSLADTGTYIAAILGVFIFKWSDFEPFALSFYVFLALYLLTDIFSLIKFRKLPSLHLYSFKIGGYIQGSFFVVLFLYDFIAWYYFLMLVWGYLAFTEHIIVQILLKEMKSNQKGLFWLLKSRKQLKNTQFFDE